MKLETTAPLASGTFVRLYLDDSVLFGEVRYSCPWKAGHLIGLYVERVLMGSSDLARLLALTLYPVEDTANAHRRVEQQAGCEIADLTL